MLQKLVHMYLKFLSGFKYNIIGNTGVRSRGTGGGGGGGGGAAAPIYKIAKSHPSPYRSVRTTSRHG